MDPLRIAVRAFAAYAFLLGLVRASGKRSIAQATPFDFLIALILGDLIDDAVWAEVSYSRFIVACGTLGLTDILIKIAAFHSPAFFRLVHGSPTLALCDGVEDRQALRREQMNQGDVEHLLRLDGIEKEKWDEVRVAYLERDHAMSLLKKPENEPVQKKDAEALKEQM